MESKLKAGYVIDIMDETTQRRVQKIIDSTRDFVQEQAEQGIDLIELAQVYLGILIYHYYE